MRQHAIGLGTTLFVLSPIIIASCAHEPPQLLPVPQAAVVCPPLKTYSAADQKALAAAVAALPPASPLVGAITDYGALRAAVRACGNSSPAS